MVTVTIDDVTSLLSDIEAGSLGAHEIAEWGEQVVSNGKSLQRSVAHDAIVQYVRMFQDRLQRDDFQENCTYLSFRLEVVETRLRRAIDFSKRKQRVAETLETIYSEVAQARIGIEASISLVNTYSDSKGGLIEPLLSRLEHMQKQAENLTAELEETKRQAEKASERVESATIDNLTALSVLTAVVLAFNAGISFTASGVSASTELGVIEVAFIVSVVGAILFNALFVLLSFLERIIFKQDDRWRILSRKAFSGINAIILAVVLALFCVLRTLVVAQLLGSSKQLPCTAGESHRETVPWLPNVAPVRLRTPGAKGAKGPFPYGSTLLGQLRARGHGVCLCGSGGAKGLAQPAG